MIQTLKLTVASSDALLTAVWTCATVLPAVQVNVRLEPEHVASAFEAKMKPTLPHKILFSRCAVTIFRLLAVSLMWEVGMMWSVLISAWKDT